RAGRAAGIELGIGQGAIQYQLAGAQLLTQRCSGRYIGAAERAGQGRGGDEDAQESNRPALHGEASRSQRGSRIENRGKLIDRSSIFDPRPYLDSSFSSSSTSFRRSASLTRSALTNSAAGAWS